MVIQKNIAFVLMLCAAIFSSNAADPRVERAHASFGAFLAKGEELADDLHFMVSLRKPISIETMEEFKISYEMNMMGIHFCSSNGGLAVFLKPHQSITQRAASLNFQELLSVNSEYITTAELGPDLMPGNVKLCGFEAKMSISSIKRLMETLQNELICVEIQGTRRRRLPVNHNLEKDEQL